MKGYRLEFRTQTDLPLPCAHDQSMDGQRGDLGGGILGETDCKRGNLFA